MSKILVIEDEPAILENVVETLQLEGFEVWGAANGKAGVDAAREYHPDLIICDIMMPELNGYGVLLALRSQPTTEHIPFMFLTAKAEREDMRKGMELGADDYLMKPFTTTELLAAVEARLQRHTTIKKGVEQKMENLRENITMALPHELRTPLTSIIGYSEMLLMDFDAMAAEQALSMVDTIYKSGMRLWRVAENYLVYAQLELLATDPSRQEATRVGQSVYAMEIIPYAAAKKAEQHARDEDMRVDVSDVAIAISSESLGKIVEELVDNAFKFSQPGKAVSVVGREKDGQYLLTVSDFGRGMTPEQVESIGAYMQFERALHEQQGLGLGLVIAQRLTELYDGKLDIRSAVDQGTTVSVSLPLA
jgi:two-component system sensor histidine kinase/response regulator